MWAPKPTNLLCTEDINQSAQNITLEMKKFQRLPFSVIQIQLPHALLNAALLSTIVTKLVMMILTGFFAKRWKITSLQRTLPFLSYRCCNTQICLAHLSANLGLKLCPDQIIQFYKPYFA